MNSMHANVEAGASPALMRCALIQGVGEGARIHAGSVRPFRWLLKPISSLLTLVVLSVAVFAADPEAPSSVDLYWKSSRAISVPGVKTVIVLDEDIAHAEVGNDTIQFTGIGRGETVALAYVNGQPVSIVVHVLDHPFVTISPSMLRREAELAHGVIGSDLQTSTANNTTNFVLLNSFLWSQEIGDHHLDIASQVEDDTQFGGHNANLRTGSISYRTPHTQIDALDFNQSLTGAEGIDRVNNFSNPEIMQLRGAGVTLTRGDNDYSFFAGSTIPYYFLSLNATRDVVGFTFHRKMSDRLSIFSGTNYANIPTTFDGNGGATRQNYFTQTAGLRYLLGKNLSIGALGGVSNRGALGRGDLAYNSYRLTAYATMIAGSQSFPLNQLQSLFSGSSSIKGGVNYRSSHRLAEGIYFEHTTISPGLVYRVAGGYDYLSPTLGYNLSRKETLNFTYTHSSNSGGFVSGTSTGNRYDFSLNSQWAQRIANTAQVTIGSVQDPLQINSQDQFTVRDSISVPVKGQTLLLGFEHDRVQPSLISRLNQELTLLSPALQAEFLADPVAFLGSSNFPPEVKALLAAEQPTGTTVSAAGNLNLGSRIRLNPNVSVTHASNGPLQGAWTQSFGYSFNYQLRPTLQFRSSLSNVLIWNSQENAAQRTTVLSAGFQKSFTATPGAFLPNHHTRIIEGRVFRDNNINGTFNPGEPGMAGVEIRLEDGEAAITDELGRYKFSGVSADQHQVSIDLAQFHLPIRMTTRNEFEADLIQQRVAIANFGVLDFARVMGNVFNDLRFEGHRQSDSRGMQDIQLLLDDGKQVRRAISSASGDFEIDNVPPGDYRMTFDASTMPANYVTPTDTFSVHVTPVATVVQDVPMRALRSISGRVLLRTKTAGGEGKAARKDGSNNQKSRTVEPGSSTESYTLTPVAGVTITANHTVVKTDQNGNFLLRNLPAGRLTVTIMPAKPIPDGVKLPSGEVNLPPDPIQVQDATIVISNAELLPYLTQEFPGAKPGMPDSVVAKESVPPAARVPKQPAIAAMENQARDTNTAIIPPRAGARNQETFSLQVAAVAAIQIRMPAILAGEISPAKPLKISEKTNPTTPVMLSEMNRCIDPAATLSLGEVAKCYRERKLLSHQ